MNIQQLGPVLKQEFARNKAKTLVLLGGFALAVFMWAPQISRFGRGQSNTEGVQPVETDAADSSAEKTDTVTSKRVLDSKSITRWDLLVKTRSENPWMRPIAKANRNPFRQLPIQVALRPLTEEEETPQRIEAEPPAPVVEIPAEKILKVTFTLVAEHRRAAVINGKMYEETDTVTISNPRENNAEELSFEIDGIAEAYVVVSRQGKQYRLLLDQDKLSKDGQVTVVRQPAD